MSVDGGRTPWSPRVHDFAAKALLVSGELWLTIGAHTRHLRVGDTFEIDYRLAHSERYGDQGATYWVARRNGRALVRDTA